MDSSSSANEVSCSGFGFNDADFSDRVLYLEIVPASSSNTSSDLRLKNFHVNSLTLATKSRFFYKLFRSGMKESQRTEKMTLRINESEEAALIDLLKYMYDIPLNATSRDELVDVLMAADKFEVPSCIKHCVNLLLKLPMSTESALFYLDLPQSVMEDDVVQSLIQAAKQNLSVCCGDFTKSQEKAMDLPLSAIEAILGSDGLRATTEYEVFQFILKWAQLHYTNSEERRDILTNRLAQFICFPNMSWEKVKEVVECPDFDSQKMPNLALKAFFHNDKISCLPRRVYDHRPIKVVQLELARPRCIVYFELSKQQCANLFTSKPIFLDSEVFCLGGRFLYLSAQCTPKTETFGLYLKMTEGSKSCTLGFDFGVMKKSSKEFKIQGKAGIVFQPNMREWGFRDLFKSPWKEFMSETSEYFIEGMLYLRADITLIS